MRKDISVIVPIYNEASTIASFLASIDPLLAKHEVILSDGGSTDGTLDAASDHRLRVVSGAKGRGAQMDLGARASRGDILFFLHCDSRAPAGADKEICDVMARYRVGCFGIAFDAKDIFLRLVAAASNARAKISGIMYGDQGIFIERELYFEIGGFKHIPIMEDLELSLALRRCGVKAGMTKSRITTSARRFERGGAIRTLLGMRRLRADYRRGVDVGEIARRYKDIR